MTLSIKDGKATFRKTGIEKTAPFSMSVLTAAWDEYKSLQVFRVLREGKWINIIMRPNEKLPIIQDATRAEVKKLADYMEFPDFMEREWTQR